METSLLHSLLATHSLLCLPALGSGGVQVGGWSHIPTECHSPSVIPLTHLETVVGLEVPQLPANHLSL